MVPTITHVPGLEISPVASRPDWICTAPKPREAAVPKTVAKMAAISMILPSAPSARFSPINGINAADSSCLRPSRKVP